MGIKVAVMIWKSLVRSILEYGCEIWGDCSLPNFERLQIQMGRKLLRCGSRTNNEVVRGELGWGTLKSRRDELRLRYWRRLVVMSEDRIPRIVYEQSRQRLEIELKNGGLQTATWCKYTKELMEELKLDEYWEANKALDEEQWKKLVKSRIHEREEKTWLGKINEKPKLRTYVKLKHKLEQEQYLLVRDRRGVPELTKLRSGTSRLRIEKGDTKT